MIKSKLPCLKEISKATKNFSEVINNFLGNDYLDIAIHKGHEQFIKRIIANNEEDIEMLDFLCGYKKLVKQHKRCKDIAAKAALYIENHANPEKINEDWLEFFFEKAKLVSDENMQTIWAQLLAKEANMPGTVNPSLLHTISIMRYDQAEFFCNIARFALREFGKDDVHLLIYISTNRVAYADSNVTPSKLKDLERLGLIECDFEKEFIFERKKVLSKGNTVLRIYGDPDNKYKIKAGNVNFTYDGKILYSLINECYKTYREDILRFIITKLKNRNCKVIINDRGNI